MKLAAFVSGKKKTRGYSSFLSGWEGGERGSSPSPWHRQSCSWVGRVALHSCPRPTGDSRACFYQVRTWDPVTLIEMSGVVHTELLLVPSLFVPRIML